MSSSSGPQPFDQRVVHRDLDVLVQAPRLGSPVGVAEGAVGETDVVVRLAALGLGRGDFLEDLERASRIAAFHRDVAEADAGCRALRIGRDCRFVRGFGGVDVAGRDVEFGQADQSRRVIRPDGERLLGARAGPFEVAVRYVQQELEVGPLEVAWRQLPDLIQAARRRVVELVVEVARAQIAVRVRRQLRLERLRGVLQGVRGERPVLPKALRVDRGDPGQVRLRHLAQVQCLLDAPDLQELGEVLGVDGLMKKERHADHDGCDDLSSLGVNCHLHPSEPDLFELLRTQDRLRSVPSSADRDGCVRRKCALADGCPNRLQL